MEAPSLIAEMQQSALFGAHPILIGRPVADLGWRVRRSLWTRMTATGLGHRCAFGQTVICQSVFPVPPPARGMGLPVVLEEDVASKLASAVGYAAWLLSRIDPTERITHRASR